MYFINICNFASECLCYYKKSLVIYFIQVFPNLFIVPAVHYIHMQTVYADFKRADCFQKCSFEVAVDRHNLACSFHLSAQCMVSVDKFIEGPAWELDNTVVQRRLEACLGFLCYGVRNFIQGVSDSNLCRNLCNRVACSLGSQS